ncbi:hypothetical protein StoSoilA2_26040 [Arthrobacter sp. StoSoilA2]|nr:hypothetical protein StoSoilA2_26040 [Arthrobacter sp. StoSoilA2]
MLANLTRAARLTQEEIFGPVAPIINFTDEDDAIALANDTVYGLAGYLMTNDLSRGPPRGTPFGSRHGRYQLRQVLPRGGRAFVEGLTVGGLGGAFSVDHEHRTEGRDWWPNEEPTREEAEALIAGGHLDILIAHDAPTGVPLKCDFQLRTELAEIANKTRRPLREVVDALTVLHLSCGHWHRRRIC